MVAPCTMACLHAGCTIVLLCWCTHVNPSARPQPKRLVLSTVLFSTVSMSVVFAALWHRLAGGAKQHGFTKPELMRWLKNAQEAIRSQIYVSYQTYLPPGLATKCNYIVKVGMSWLYTWHMWTSAFRRAEGDTFHSSSPLNVTV